MSLSATVKASISADHLRSIDLAGATSNLQRALALAFTDGVGANQVDLIFHDQRTLAASASEDIDLNGVLTDIYGQSVNFARIKAVLVLPAVANLNNINISRPASNGVPLFLAASDGIVVHPGGIFLWAVPSAAGVAVTAGTGDLLTITNAAGTNSVVYDIVILGAAT